MRVPVAARLLPRPRRAAEIGENALQVRRDGLHAFAFRSHSQKLLLEIEIERQRAGEMKRKHSVIGCGKILYRSGESEDFPVQFHGVRGALLRWRSGFVGHQQYFGAQERTLLVEFEHFKPMAAFGDQIETSVFVFPGDADDLGCASDLGDAMVNGSNHAEDRTVGAAFADHLFVARLENVQRQRRAGKQHEIERE